MIPILDLFYRVTSIIGVLSLLLPVITDIIARKKSKNKFTKELKLFEFFVYFTLIMQFFAIGLSKIVGVNNLIIFRIYLPVHVAIFSYLLIKWTWNKNNVLWSIIFFLVSYLGDYITGNYNTPPNFMIWFDAVILFVLSFCLSFISDKRKVHLSKKYNYIHIGVYLYSIITIIGISPSFTELRTYGFFFQGLAIVVSNYYFARSFRCLYHSNG